MNQVDPALQSVIDDENAQLEKARQDATFVHLQNRVVLLAKEKQDLLNTVDELNKDLEEMGAELDEYRQTAQEREEAEDVHRITDV